MFWGLSETLDLLNEYLNIYKNEDTISKQIDNSISTGGQNINADDTKKHFKEHINILLFGANDPRHIIKTIAKVYTHRSQGISTIINFYLVDGCVEIVARNMALLGIALESPNILNLRTKVHLFMDIYGNSLTRPSSQRYLLVKARSLLKAVTNKDFLNKLTPMLDIGQMKYWQRDGLENAFNFWLSKDPNIFKIQEYWNVRLRRLMGPRFDYREGQFDWDLNMALKERDGKQICSQEYRYWRENGIAFTFPEYEYSKPNKTLSVGLVRNGDTFIHRGYVGDIQTGPYAAFGLKTNETNMCKSIHGENEYRATDVTERNLLELFHELATQTPYQHDVSMSRKYGMVRLQMGKCLPNSELDIDNTKEYDKPWIFIDGIKITFLLSNDFLTLQQNTSEQWSQFFDVAFVGHNYFKFLKDDFVNILRPQSVLIMETKLLSTARKDEINNFEEQLLNYAKQNNLKNTINYNAINSKNTLLKFKRDFYLSK